MSQAGSLITRAVFTSKPARAELESRGVEYDTDDGQGVCYQAFFEDPDGNLWALARRRFAAPLIDLGRRAMRVP
jgi:hypothetical protein